MQEDGTITTENLNTELKKNFDNDNEVEEVTGGWLYIATKSYTIHQDGNVEEGENYLPNEYKTLKYIEGTGSQYINTGIKANDHPNIIVEIEGSYTNSQSSQFIFGAGKSSKDFKSWILMGQTSTLGIIGQIGRDNSEQKIIDFDTDKHLFKLDTSSNKVSVDSKEVEMAANGEGTISLTYCLFAINNGGTIMKKAKFKMYSCKITKNGESILNLVPCLDENNVPCMYDLVSKKCFYNNGTGAFGYEQ